MVDRLEQSGELLSNFSLGVSGIEVSTQTLSEADQWQVTESATQRPGHGGRHDSGKCQPHRHPGKRLEEPKGEPAAEGAGAVHPELGTWQEAPAMLHKWQLLWLTSRAHGLSHLAQGTGTGQSTLHSGFGLEQRAVTPPPGEGRLKASHGVTLTSTCWASRGGCGGPLWLGACAPTTVSHSRDPGVVAGRSRSAPWETPWVPVKGRERALQSHPQQLVRSSTAAAWAPVLPRAPGPWGPTPGPGGRGKPQPSHPELGAGAAPDPAAPWGRWGNSCASPTVEPDDSGG